MRNITILLIIFVVLLSGCATGSAIVTGQQRPSVPSEKVKLYMAAPSKYEVIGIVEATSKGGGTDQSKMDRAVDKLKEKAGSLGANGVLIQSSGEKSGVFVGVSPANNVLIGNRRNKKTVSGQAIFVIQE